MLETIDKLNYDRINEVAYASESELVKDLLNYLQDDYNNRLKK